MVDRCLTEVCCSESWMRSPMADAPVASCDLPRPPQTKINGLPTITSVIHLSSEMRRSSINPRER